MYIIYLLINITITDINVNMVGFNFQFQLVTDNTSLWKQQGNMWQQNNVYKTQTSNKAVATCL